MTRHVVDLLDALLDEERADDVWRLARALDAPTGASAVSRAAGDLLGLVSRLRRRERELRALFDTAREIAGAVELDSALAAIVRRARMLVSTDLAYLMLTEPPASRPSPPSAASRPSPPSAAAASEGADWGAGRVVMRAAEGAVTAAFFDISLALGQGLAGRVVAEGTAFWTADYARDPRFQHVIDDTVAAEGLIAIAGVPLRGASGIIGVLCAADRGRREVSPDDIALLAALADHAAVAIESRIAADATAQAMAGLTVAHERLRVALHELAQVSGAHEELSRLVVEGGQADDVVTVLAGRLGRTVRLVDLDRAAEPEHAGSAAERGRHSAVAAGHGFPVVVHDVPVAVLVVDGAPMSEIDARICERAALVIAFFRLLSSSRHEASRRTRSALLQAALEAPAGGPPSAGQSSLSGPHRVVVLDVGGAEFPLVDRGLAAASPESRIWTSWRGALVVVEAGPGDPRALADELRARASRLTGRTVTAAVLPLAGGVAEIRSAAADGRACVAALRGLGRAGEIASPRDLGALGLLMGTASAGAVADFVDSRLGPLLAHDRERHGRLTDTVEAWLAAGASPSDAAQQLGIHVNTLYQRLDRVSTLLGPSWRDPGRRLELHLALQLRHIVVERG